MQLTNTLTRKKENFKPMKEEKVKVYYCGPTPYDYTTIGNFRAYLVSDMVVRTLRFLGYKVETSMNITDIDDKTIKNSQIEGVDLKTFTERYFNYFLIDLENLGIRKADNISPISLLIPEMVSMINGLLEKGYAYLAEDGSIYYSIAKFKNYGDLAHLDKKGMKTGVRISLDEYEKEEVGDFALWKAYDEKNDGPNRWEGKFMINGKEETIYGRPGWHIECSACNMKFFGEQIDLHMGGIDNIFPHHQNEIAQTEAYTGKIFSKYWLHNGYLLVDNKKMSKSKKNFYTLVDVVDKMKGEANESYIYRGYRFMNYGAKYSESFNFTFDRLRQAIQNIKTFDEAFRRIKNYKKIEGKVSKETSDNLQYFVQNYITSLEDDFSTVEALVSVFDLVKYVNSGIDDNLFNSAEIDAIIGVFKTFNEVLNVFDFNIFEEQEPIPENIIKLLEQRNAEKSAKNFEMADKLRDEISLLGYKIVDDKNGSRAERQ
ncbi:MAG: cysteine--tRNA ligase [Candidatus Gracilibacteria bacterium]|nr:cysteine--tRNA ligase [Candidatus Gracilibacteria bacterium]